MPRPKRQPAQAPQEAAPAPQNGLRLTHHSSGAKTPKECIVGFIKAYQGLESLFAKACKKASIAGQFLLDYVEKTGLSKFKAIQQIKHDEPRAKDISNRTFYVCMQLAADWTTLVALNKTEVPINEALHWIGNGVSRCNADERTNKKKENKDKPDSTDTGAGSGAGSGAGAGQGAGAGPDANGDGTPTDVGSGEPDDDLPPLTPEEIAEEAEMADLMEKVKAVFAKKKLPKNPILEEIFVDKRLPQVTINIKPDTVYVIVPQ